MTARDLRIKKFNDIITKLESCKGFIIDSATRNLEICYRLVVINYNELKKTFQRLQLYATHELDKKRDQQIEIYRVTTNFLASCFALIDQTRAFIIRNEGSQEEAFDGQFQEKINNEFKNDPLTNFIKDLRKIITHEDILPTGVVWKFNEDGTSYGTAYIFTKRVKLKSLSAPGKHYVTSTKGNIDIKDMCRKYLDKLPFPWVMQKVGEYHKEEFIEMKRLQADAKKAHKEIN